MTSTTTAVRDRMDATTIDVPPGLAGVVVAETELGDVRGLEGFYHYREHSAVELARTRSVEDVWQLMLDGALPEASEAASIRRRGPIAPRAAREHCSRCCPRSRSSRRRVTRLPGCGPRCLCCPARTDCIRSTTRIRDSAARTR